MHACLLKAEKMIEVGVQGSKLSIYTYVPYIRIIAYMITRKLRKSCLLNKAKARKECHTLIPSMPDHKAKIQYMVSYIAINTWACRHLGKANKLEAITVQTIFSAKWW